MSARGFAHHALVYTAADGPAAEAAAFLRGDGAAATVALVPPETAALLSPAVPGLRVLDLAAVGANPARIVPVLREVAESADRVRCVVQAWWPHRSAAATAEVTVHEAVLDTAFAEFPGFTVGCPFPTDAPEWVASCHRYTATGPNPDYRADFLVDLFTEPLADPEAEVTDVAHFNLDDLPDLRDLISVRADAAGLPRDRALDMTLAANEIITNSICHGGERGTLRLWSGDGAFVCEVSDSGHIESPLVGRVAPLPSIRGGRGIWLANQVCDLVQIRSGRGRGTVVRLFMDL